MEEHAHTSNRMDNSPSNHSTSNSSDSEEPKDLSMNHQHNHKTVKKLKPIPPPLDLSQSSQILDCSSGSQAKSLSGGSSACSSPSPHNHQKNLPFRKRAHCSTLSGHSPSLSPLKEPLDSPPASSTAELWRNHLISTSSSDLIYHTQYSTHSHHMSRNHSNNTSAGGTSPASNLTSAGSSKSGVGLLSSVKQETPSDTSSGLGSQHLPLGHHPSSPYATAKSPHEMNSGGYLSHANNTDIKPPDLSLRHSQSMSTILDPHPSLQRLSYMNQLSPLWYQTSALLSPAPSSLGSSREELNWNFPWPPPVWHCFMSGTLIQIPNLHHPSSPVQWLLVDDLAHSRIVFDWPGRLRIKQLISNTTSDTHTIVFSSCEGELVAQCRSSHMFYDKERGWSCLDSDTASKLYGGGVHKYRHLQVNDVVVPVQSSCPPHHKQLPVLSPPAHVLSPDLCDRMKRFSFPVSDEPSPSSFLPPTSMHAHQPSLFAFPILSPPTTPTHKEGGGEKPKRPMNAFMLFAKRYRLELIQNNPGKDNRAISVLLGEAWKSLPQDEKDVYVNEAKTLAQEQKMLHPDCWKRKRSHSTS